MGFQLDFRSWIMIFILFIFPYIYTVHVSAFPAAASVVRRKSTDAIQRR